MKPNSKQTHSGPGDNVAGDQSKIGQQINLEGGQFIKNQFLNTEEKIPGLLTTPPFIPDIFEGREEDLQAVHDKLFTGEQLLLLVNGEGGIGKTTLAAKYWQRYADEYHHRTWVFAQSSLVDALLTLAQPLRVEFPETMPTDQRLEQLLAAMGNLDEPCLLVIDNANDIDDLEQHYPALRTCRKFRLLLTTRITSFEQAETYRVKPLDEADALTLFKKHYPQHQATEDKLFNSIHAAVGGNTLVLELLAKNLAAINADEVFYSLTELLQDLQKKGLLQLSQTENVSLVGKNELSLKKENPINIIAALYNELEMVVPLDVDEQMLLSNLAVLPAENLPYTLLKTLLDPPDAKLFSSRLTSLAKRGWIEKGQWDQATFYKISPVVQEIIRHKNKAHLLSYCTLLINTLLDKLDYQPGSGHFINVSYQDAALYCRYAEAATACFQESDNNLAILRDRIGNYYKTIGNLYQALGFFKDYNRLEKELYNAYPDNVEFKDLLAISYQKLGKTYSALWELDQALGFFNDYNRLEKELCDTYPDNVKFKNGLAISYQNLGITYTKLGDLDQALGFFNDYNHLEKELYDANPDNVEFKDGLATSYQKLGDTYTALGDLDQALGLFKDFNRLEKELYDTYPDNVEFKNGLAISYQKLGKTYNALNDLDQALGFFKDYNLLEKKLYDAYPDNVKFKNSLALSLQWLGWIHEKLEKPKLASDYYTQSGLLLEQMVKQFPQYVEFKNNLEWGNNRLIDIHNPIV